MADHAGDAESVYRALTESLSTALGADEVHVHGIANDNADEPVTIYRLGGFGRQSVTVPRIHRPVGVGWVAASGQPLVAGDRASLLTVAPEMAAQGMTTAVLGPVVVDGRMRAVVTVARRGPEAFTETEVDRACGLVDHAATAVALVDARSDASQDLLTGCLNRRGMVEQLNAEIGRAQRHRTPLCCLVLDLDDFKRVNDLFGHPAGDSVLAEVGQRLRREFRAIDHVARYGGDEFVVILPDAPVRDAADVAMRALGALRGLPRGSGLHAGSQIASAGLAEWAEPMDSMALLAIADAALLEAKRTGKGALQVTPAPSGRFQSSRVREAAA